MNSDKNYWGNYYRNRKEGFSPSSFAEFCFENYLKKDDLVIDLGCGNGKDSLYFASNGLKIIGIDQCESAIQLAKNEALLKKLDVNFFVDDFVSYDYSRLNLSPKVFYSRFTIHSITETSQNNLLQNIRNNFSKRDRLFIELRTRRDELFGKGKKVGSNEYFTDHYRRFIDSNEFLKALINKGFKSNFFIESKDLAVYKDENPIVARYILSFN